MYRTYSGFKFSQLEMSASYVEAHFEFDFILTWATETVLSTLVASFKFELSKTPIH